MTREELLALGQTGDTVTFVNSAQSALTAHPEDADLRLLLIQHLVQAGLFHRAACLARGFDAAILERADFAGLVRQLESTRENGLAGWDRYAAQFDANLAVARRRFEWVADVERAWQSANLELHISRDGRFQVFEPNASGLGEWRPAFGLKPPSDRLEDLKRQAAGQVVSPIIIDGVAFGETALLFHAATSDTLNGASPFIYVVELSPLALAVALHVQDWRPLLEDERVIFCLGESAYETLEQEIASRPNAPAPQIIVSSPAWSGRTTGRSADIIRRAVARIDAQKASIRAEVESMYADRDAAYWARRYRAAISGGERPLRILALTSLYTTVLQYSTRDSLSALSELGFETKLLIEQDKHSFTSPAESMAAIREFQPDLVFMIDHTRKTQRNLLIANVPVMTWIQDRLTWLFSPTSGSAMGPLDFCMGLGRDELVMNHQYPGERFFGCEMATNPAALGEHSSDEATDERFACDVAFASHCSEPPDLFLEESIARLDESGHSDLMRAIYWELKSRSDAGVLNGALDFDHFLNEIMSAVGTSLETAGRESLMSFFLRPLADRFLRHQTIAWAARWVDSTGRRLNLYGAGWEHHPQFARYARGNLPHGRELGRAFRGATINLHAGLNWAFHQRVLDGLTAGGFFLFRRHGADVSHDVSRRIHEFVKPLRDALPVLVTAADLDSETAEQFRQLRRWKGRDPESGLQINQRLFEILERRFSEGADLTPGLLWPELPELTFESEQGFIALAESYVNEADRRRSIADRMRAPIVERFSYKALLGRAMEWLTATLEAGASRSMPREAVVSKASRAMDVARS